MVSQQYDIGIVLRNNDPGNGGFDGYTIFWSAFGDGRGFADAFITVDKPGANILFEENVPVPTPGAHTLGAAVLANGTINVYVDGVLTATVVDPSPLPPGNAGLNFGWTGSPPGIVWINTFAEGLHPLDSATVKLERDNVQVWPSGLNSVSDGESGTFQVELRVKVLLNDTTVKNKWVKLSLAAVDSSGRGSDAPYGHFHGGANGLPKPAGTLSKDSVNTEDGTGVVRYTSSQVSGPVVIRAQAAGTRPDSMTIPVGVPQMEQLEPDGTFKLVGVKGIHPSSNWVMPKMRTQAEMLADAFFLKFNKPIGFNDASLHFGGKFDLEEQWDGPASTDCKLNGKHNPIGCHQRHRVGRNIDLDNPGMTQTEANFARVFWETKIKGYVGKEAGHYHIKGP